MITSEEKLAFNGTLNNDTRTELREKRKKLGLSYDNMADFIGVHWSTYRKWELGPTARCSMGHTRTLNALLNGKYDYILAATKKGTAEKDHDAEKILNSLSLISSLISDAPPIREEFNNKLNSILDNAVHALISE